jgi:hypothetical protein
VVILYLFYNTTATLNPYTIIATEHGSNKPYCIIA